MIKTLKRLYSEIKLLGIKDWWWFVVHLKRNEFSPELTSSKYFPDHSRLIKDRERAHEIDLKLSSLTKT